MKVAAAVLAAGSGTRFGADKTAILLRGRPIWRWSIDVLLGCPEVDVVILVTAADRVESLRSQAPEGVRVIAGGDSRQASSFAALDAAGDAEILLVHDAARPFLTPEMVYRVIEGTKLAGAAGLACPVTDTIRLVNETTTQVLPREQLVAMQTPQGARTALLRQAQGAVGDGCTDDLSLVEAIGVAPLVIPGDPTNFKITTPSDLQRAKAHLGIGEMRTGFGYDIHPFSDDPSRSLWLGGVHFPGHRALDGHSDADVLLHAVTDALLGAAAKGDIGVHFPNTDPQWKGKESIHFLAQAAKILAEDGWRVVNLDATCVAESPKIMKRAADIRAAIAGAIGIDVDRVSVKATTNERLGSIGRSEGIAAFATATIVRV